MNKILPPKIIKSLAPVLAQFKRYRFLLFAVAVLAAYGYIAVTIVTLQNTEPTEDMISERSNPIRAAKIDPKLVNQLRRLEDNSVSVKALFNEKRRNPFAE